MLPATSFHLLSEKFNNLVETDEDPTCWPNCIMYMYLYNYGFMAANTPGPQWYQ